MKSPIIIKIRILKLYSELRRHICFLQMISLHISLLEFDVYTLDDQNELRDFQLTVKEIKNRVVNSSDGVISRRQ